MEKPPLLSSLLFRYHLTVAIIWFTINSAINETVYLRISFLNSTDLIIVTLSRWNPATLLFLTSDSYFRLQANHKWSRFISFSFFVNAAGFSVTWPIAGQSIEQLIGRQNHLGVYFGLLYLARLVSFLFAQNYCQVIPRNSKRSSLLLPSQIVIPMKIMQKVIFICGLDRSFVRWIVKTCSVYQTIFVFAMQCSDTANRSGLEFSKFHLLTILNVNNCARNKWSISCGKPR